MSEEKLAELIEAARLSSREKALLRAYFAPEPMSWILVAFNATVRQVEREVFLAVRKLANELSPSELNSLTGRIQHYGREMADD